VRGVQVYGYYDASAFSIAPLTETFALGISRVLFWMKVNRIQHNPNKPECLWNHSTRSSVAAFPDLFVGGVLIHPSTSAKSLGVYTLLIGCCQLGMLLPVTPASLNL
jgi:hypothetical protein